MFPFSGTASQCYASCCIKELALGTIQIIQSTYVFFCRKSASRTILHKHSVLEVGSKWYGRTSISWLSDKVAHFLCGKLKPTVQRGISLCVLTVNTKWQFGAVVTSMCLQQILKYKYPRKYISIWYKAYISTWCNFATYNIYDTKQVYIDLCPTNIQNISDKFTYTLEKS